MISKLFNSQSKTITFAAGLLAISALISRFLGLIRDRLLAGRFGAGQELDIYFTAFRIPDFVYGILIMGGVAAVFLPVFSEYFKKDETGEKAWQFTSNLLNCFLILLVLICSVLVFLTPWIVDLIAPGFSQASRELTVKLTRIMFLSPILFGLSSVFSGILHYFNRFLAYAFAPILYNLGIIFGIIFLVPIFGLSGLAYGVIVGAFFHLIIQIPAARNSGWKYLPLLNFKNFGLIKLFQLMIPRTIGSAAYHINLIVITAIASTLTTGSIAIFNLANNLQYFPIGLIGVSFSIAAFPILSKKWAAGLKQDFLETFSATFRQILFLIMPTCFLIFILRAQIVRIVLGTGEFGWLETRLTAALLGIFALSVFSVSFVTFLAKVFYSFQDTKTPVLISLISMGLNIILCFLFVFLLTDSNFFKDFLVNFLKLEQIKDIRLIGLPLALSIASIFQFCLLLVFLRQKMKGFQTREILTCFWKTIIACLIMAVSAYFSLWLVVQFLEIKTVFNILIQTIITGLFALLVYLSVSVFLKAPEVKIIWSAIFYGRK